MYMYKYDDVVGYLSQLFMIWRIIVKVIISSPILRYYRNARYGKRGSYWALGKDRLISCTKRRGGGI